MKKLRLKYRLEPIKENLYEFEILEMDESFRSTGDTFTTKDGSVASETYPTIYNMGLSKFNICLRGDLKGMDEYITTIKITKEQADIIHQILKEWSTKWFKNNQ